MRLLKWSYFCVFTAGLFLLPLPALAQSNLVVDPGFDATLQARDWNPVGAGWDKLDRSGATNSGSLQGAVNAPGVVGSQCLSVSGSMFDLSGYILLVGGKGSGEAYIEVEWFNPLGCGTRLGSLGKMQTPPLRDIFDKFTQVGKGGFEK